MKLIKYILATFVVLIISISCLDDTSTLDINGIAGVEIDTTGNSSFSVYQFDKLIVEPNLNHEGLPEDNLEYQWSINLEPNDTLYTIISEERNLNYEVRFKPNVSGKFHQLVYTVTDKINGLDYIMAWPVKVLNNIGEGIVIAETTDNVTTDISHIMSPKVTTNFEGISVKHQVYSSINGVNIAGITKQLRFAKVYGVDVMFGITDESIYKINTLDYTFAGNNNDLFYANAASYSPDAIGGVYQGDLYISNGKLTSTYLGASRSFGLPFNSSFYVPGIIAANPNSNPAVVINFYDEVNDQFVYQPSITQFGDNTMYAAPATAEGAFNPTSIANKINLAAVVSTSGEFKHLLKDETTGSVELYVFDAGGSNYPNTIPPAPIASYDLSNAPDISQANQFVLLNNQKVLYYATDTKIYAVLYASGTPIYEERYTTEASETITTLQVYQQADYPLRSSEDYLPLNNNALLMSTYDGNEGRVYIMPIINLGVGNIDTGNIEVFEGFNRITAMATQL
ncbi:PKD-like family lipoprotein [Lutibacter aestuarii]|uniref:PKD-like family lipoprotein n=1 Tax=Lutibacter aestuarii TaxID=861111 RepID=A0ABW2Z5T5_9FLAO